VTIEPSKGAEAVAFRDAIEQIILDFAGYGYRRVTHALQRDGWKVNHKRVLRIMREESLLCQIKRHFVQTNLNIGQDPTWTEKKEQE
jgi:putative transposase